MSPFAAPPRPRRTPADRRAEGETLRQQYADLSGTRRYGLSRAEDQEVAALEEAVRVAGGWEQVNPDRYRELQATYREGVRLAQESAANERHPGWQVPAAEHSRWPLYVTEAVTFTTEWGPVTVGRSLARIYDLDGWPDAAVLQAMVEQQAAAPPVEGG